MFGKRKKAQRTEKVVSYSVVDLPGWQQELIWQVRTSKISLSKAIEVVVERGGDKLTFALCNEGSMGGLTWADGHYVEKDQWTRRSR